MLPEGRWQVFLLYAKSLIIIVEWNVLAVLASVNHKLLFNKMAGKINYSELE